MGNEICQTTEDLSCCLSDNQRILFRKKSFQQQKHKNKFYINSYKISQDYIILNPPIGKGSYGSVYKVLSRSTNLIRAVKRITRKEKSLQQLQQILILKKLDHPHIIRIHDIYVEELFIYLVMEYCSGGQLFDRIIQNNRITQNEAKDYMKQLLSAISNCHSNKIMHRDLKPENIVFSSKQSKDLKIIDFGAGKCFSQNKSQNLKIGSIYYIAPEVIRQKYNQKCDIWSLGVILYIMISGVPPFNGKNDKAIYQKIMSGKIKFPEKRWSKVSKDAQDLIRKMLTYQPQNRISARHALLHPWILSACKSGDKNIYLVNEMQSMKQFARVNKFQSAVTSFISYNLMQAKSLSKLKQVFKDIDSNGDGKISQKQFKQCYFQHMPPIPEQEINQMFRKLDQNNSGFIDYTEFISSALHKNYEQNDNLLEKAFNLIDKDGDGYLDVQQLQIAFGNTDPSLTEQMLKDADSDSDGKISRQQFKAAMKNISLKQKNSKSLTKSTKTQ